MTSYNGANNHTVEDLLSSIRTSIAEDHGGMRAGPSSPLNSNPARHMSRPDASAGHDATEFDLPAIFKPGHTTTGPDKSSKLFGRLSDALKPASSAESDRTRTVIRFEPAGGRMIEPPAAPTAHAAPTDKPDAVASKVEADNNSVGRHMPSFFDTRLNRIGEMTRQVNRPKPVEPPPPAQQPPPLKPQHIAQTDQQSSGGLEDAAAQLLRPILKQWLTENMPKIVEKALRSEAGDDFAPPNGSDTRRKP